ncbi:hypothetical protein [Rathayibacter sp. AY1C5]|uniref:hypothetical protein n=1 Tax=Rathayibacter sp. AY1C5 TaxID=2080538 RepID=UPI000CE813E8|nr:hypothetical protein [Rathayibacter sp. AY1C5]PPG60254.1 hypothetical protein C5C57_05490 [Rathayibacter sp. AY1C5]
MISATLVALLRLIPYIFTAVNAWTKGYRWLTISAVFVSILALANYLYVIPHEIQGLLSSVYALLLMTHALDLKPKGSE